MSQVFISHVEEDAALALEIARGLEAAGYDTWYYERDSEVGDQYLLHIGQAIEQADAFILIISPDSVSSNQVTSEVVRAHEADKAFLPLLSGITHADFQQRQPLWRMALGAAVAIAVPPEGAAAILPRLIRGLAKLGIHPANMPGEASGPASYTALQSPLPPILHEVAETAARPAARKWPWVLIVSLVVLAVAVGLILRSSPWSANPSAKPATPQPALVSSTDTPPPPSSTRVQAAPPSATSAALAVSTTARPATKTPALQPAATPTAVPTPVPDTPTVRALESTATPADTVTPLPPTAIPTSAPPPTARAATPSWTPTSAPPPTATRASTPVPTPAPALLPAPELRAPADGSQFRGSEATITLEWTPVPGLSADDYYVVVSDFPHDSDIWNDYQWTKEPNLVVPAYLYDNLTGSRAVQWRVVVMRLTGQREDGQKQGYEISSPSQVRSYVWEAIGSGPTEPTRIIEPTRQS
jgi:hypothetical protein